MPRPPIQLRIPERQPYLVSNSANQLDVPLAPVPHPARHRQPENRPQSLIVEDGGVENRARAHGPILRKRRTRQRVRLDIGDREHTHAPHDLHKVRIVREPIPRLNRGNARFADLMHRLDEIFGLLNAGEDSAIHIEDRANSSREYRAISDASSEAYIRAIRR